MEDSDLLDVYGRNLNVVMRIEVEEMKKREYRYKEGLGFVGFGDWLNMKDKERGRVRIISLFRGLIIF